MKPSPDRLIIHSASGQIIVMNYKRINTKDELLDRMFELLDEADAVDWPSKTPYSFIQHMAAWLDQAHLSGYDTSHATWDLFGRMLEAGRGEKFAAERKGKP